MRQFECMRSPQVKQKHWRSPQAISQSCCHCFVVWGVTKSKNISVEVTVVQVMSFSQKSHFCHRSETGVLGNLFKLIFLGKESIHSSFWLSRSFHCHRTQLLCGSWKINQNDPKRLDTWGTLILKTSGSDWVQIANINTSHQLESIFMTKTRLSGLRKAMAPGDHSTSEWQETHRVQMIALIPPPCTYTGPRAHFNVIVKLQR